MSSGEPKQYGLILPNKKNSNDGGGLGIRKLNPLLDSDDELDQDEESPLNWVEASLKKSAGNSGQQSLQKRLLREALEEDASVFQYDEVYDSMQAAKTAQQVVKNPAAKKPKYIHNLIKHAEKRKLEGERRNERKVQREREAEGDEFADKESFVTTSYLKKMEELKKAEAEAKLQEMREEQVDVMKHKNFGVFYSHLFKQRIGEPSIKEEPKSEDEDNTGDKQLNKKDENRRQKHYRTQRDLSESPERKEQQGRTHALHHSSSDSSDSEAGEKVESYRDRRAQYNAMTRGKEIEKQKRKERHLTSLDKTRERRERSRERRHGREKASEQERRHRGRQRSGSFDKRQRHSRSRSPVPRRVAAEGRGDRRMHRRSPSGTKLDSPRRTIIKEEHSPDKNDRKESKASINDKKDIDKPSDGQVKKDMKLKKVSEDEEKEKRQMRIQKLFNKRTVGDKFDEAVQRYYQRKADREAQG